MVTQGAKSLESLQMMEKFFGVGRLHCNHRHDNHKENLYQYVVSKRTDLLNKIIPFFQQFQLRTSKRLDFEKFVKCMRVIQAGAHLTPRGLLEILEVMQTMNHCKPRTEMIRILRDYMPDTEFIYR